MVAAARGDPYCAQAWGARMAELSDEALAARCFNATRPDDQLIASLTPAVPASTTWCRQREPVPSWPGRERGAMTEVPPPDWAALYQEHRHTMYRVAARVLRNAGREAEAADAVMAAMESLMKSPPRNVTNWEAMLVKTTKRRALDLLRSASVRHTGRELEPESDAPDQTDVAAEVVELVDLRRGGAYVWDALASLDERHRKVVWEYVALGRPRQDVAAELGVTPARVSQMATKALRILREELEKKGVTL
jgi:RNA polymerase sigma factor (sigma-70 family)